MLFATLYIVAINSPCISSYLRIRDCSPTTKTVLERVCIPKVDKVCKSVIEETTEERCKV